MDETVREWFQDYAIAADHYPFVKRNGDLLPGWPNPITNRCGYNDNRGDN